MIRTGGGAVHIDVKSSGLCQPFEPNGPRATLPVCGVDFAGPEINHPTQNFIIHIGHFGRCKRCTIYERELKSFVTNLDGVYLGKCGFVLVTAQSIIHKNIIE